MVYDEDSICPKCGKPANAMSVSKGIIWTCKCGETWNDFDSPKREIKNENKS